MRPAPLDAIIRAIAGRSDETDQRASTFARGLALGALVGAAIAGSTLWQRRQARPPLTPGAAVPDDATKGETPVRSD